MKMTIEIDCTPAEARAFVGLPDVTSINDHLVAEVKRQMDENLARVQPDELVRSWLLFGGQAQEQFRKMMTTAASGGLAGAGAVREDRG